MQLPAQNWLFNQAALTSYLLCCCQDTSGGMLDKPDKRRDYYHTCYCLSGLSVAQNTFSNNADASVIGNDAENKVKPIHPVFNINLQAIESLKHYNFD